MFIDFGRFDRHLLSKRQRDFLLSLVPLTQLIQQQVIAKCEYGDRPGVETIGGVLPSVVTAHCIFVSNWGKHKAAQDKIKIADGEDSWVHGNNLALNRANKYWPHDVVRVGEIFYKSYMDRSAFVIDMSDIFSWTEDYADVLATNNVDSQVKLMSKRQKDPVKYQTSLLEIVARLGLTQYDKHSSDAFRPD